MICIMLARLWSLLPHTATAPFCPSEVEGSIAIPPQASLWKKILIYMGPGLLVSVGYMDPGNWATDIEAGSKYGYSLLWVVLLASLAAIVLQCFSMRLGVVTQKDLAQLCKQQYSKTNNFILWMLAELAIVMTDIAEVLGSGLAFHLLFGCSLQMGIWLTILDTMIVLGLKGKGVRQIEAVVFGLILTIGIAFFLELFLVHPIWAQVVPGYVPTLSSIQGLAPLYVAIGIWGATVMPHNLFLHSSIVHSRAQKNSASRNREALRFNTIDTVASLGMACIVNSAILILAGAAFHATGHTQVTEIDEAFHLLDPLVGGRFASVVFALALLASGQSSTLTGTIAGQVVLEGFTKWSIPCWQRRLLTRALALLPALLGVSWLGTNAVGKMLVLSQVVLSVQLPFTIFPLLKFVSDPNLMREFVIPKWSRILGWAIFFIILIANIALLFGLVISPRSS